ncbi:hypothetical protein XENORESO_012554 [Xenotaenia resolanae]|uniref:Uncharacterized protein n=1 Tax=Xenotaenia resolanae TaxID=208358 RepID=A0ABV0X897_9TELE
MENPYCERMGPTIKLRSYIIEYMSQGWVNSSVMFWRDNKARSEKSQRFALNSWGLLQIGQSKYLAFSTDQPLPVVHIKHTCCLSALRCVRAVKSARVGEAVNRGFPNRMRTLLREHPEYVMGRLLLSRDVKVLNIYCLKTGSIYGLKPF